MPIYQVPDIVYPPLLTGKNVLCYVVCTYTCTRWQPQIWCWKYMPPFFMEKRGNFLCKFIFNCVKDSKLQNGTREACKYCVNLMLHQCKIKYSLQLKKLKFLYLQLAYMATSGGHFSRPSRMGSFWNYSGWKIFEMAIFRKEWQ